MRKGSIPNPDELHRLRSIGERANGVATLVDSTELDRRTVVAALAGQRVTRAALRALLTAAEAIREREQSAGEASQ